MPLVIEQVPLDKLKLHPKNPRKGNVPAIAESLRVNGQVQPIVVQRSTGHIIGGNHTYKAAQSLGWTQIDACYLDVDDQEAHRIMLALNRTPDLATYDTDILADVLKSLDNPIGTGYSDEDYKALLEAVESSASQDVEAIIRPPVSISPVEDDGSFEGVEGGPPTAFDADDDEPEQEEDDENMNNVLGELQGILTLKEDMQFKSSNYYGIPDLVPKMIPQKLPDPIDTWGGQEATPDDGVTTWVWNYGVAAFKGLPTDRAIVCFYTYDTYFESWWENPGFYAAKMLNAGIKMAVVPDFSFYSDTPVAEWVYNTFRAQWLGRYLQEAGIQVIPRIQFGIDKKDSASLDFCMMGIPKNPTVLASCMHNMGTKEEFENQCYNWRKCLQVLQPKQLLVYGGNPALRVVEEVDPVGNGIAGEIVHIYNYAHKRRGVVYDKKEGLAGKKRKKRDDRDKAEGQGIPKAPRRNKKQNTQDDEMLVVDSGD